MDKAQLVQEVQRIGNGAIGEKTAYAIQHAAAQNNVSSMVNLPQNYISRPEAWANYWTRSATVHTAMFSIRASVGMAIVTMGGSFIDCNLAFT